MAWTAGRKTHLVNPMQGEGFYALVVLVLLAAALLAVTDSHLITEAGDYVASWR